MSSARPHRLISEEGDRSRAQQEALGREQGACVTKEMQVRRKAQEIQGLPRQLGTPAPNGPKIPSADKGILSATRSKQAGRRLQTGSGKPGLFRSEQPRCFSEGLDERKTLAQEFFWRDLGVWPPPTQTLRGLPRLVAQDTRWILVTQLGPLRRWGLVSTEGWGQEVHSSKLGRNKHEGFPAAWVSSRSTPPAPRRIPRPLAPYLILATRFQVSTAVPTSQMNKPRLTVVK